MMLLIVSMGSVLLAGGCSQKPLDDIVVNTAPVYSEPFSLELEMTDLVRNIIQKENYQLDFQVAIYGEPKDTAAVKNQEFYRSGRVYLADEVVTYTDLSTSIVAIENISLNKKALDSLADMDYTVEIIPMFTHVQGNQKSYNISHYQESFSKNIDAIQGKNIAMPIVLLGGDDSLTAILIAELEKAPNFLEQIYIQPTSREVDIDNFACTTATYIQEINDSAYHAVTCFNGNLTLVEGVIFEGLWDFSYGTLLHIETYNASPANQELFDENKTKKRYYLINAHQKNSIAYLYSIKDTYFLTEQSVTDEIADYNDLLWEAVDKAKE